MTSDAVSAAKKIRKTMLLRVLYNALRPWAGLVTLDDTQVAMLGPRDLARRFAVVAQESPSVIPVTVADMISLGIIALPRLP